MNLRLGIVGWRGMVGSVLVQRMQAEKDFLQFSSSFFSTSQAGEALPESLTKMLGAASFAPTLKDACNLSALGEMDIILCTQGGIYTSEIQPKLRKAGWQGFWVDAASTLRLESFSTLTMDPVNLALIEADLLLGKKDFIGANCTTAILVMGLSGLFKKSLVHWVSFASYQSVSGSGAKAIESLLQQTKAVSDVASALPAGYSALQSTQSLSHFLQNKEQKRISDEALHPSALSVGPIGFNVLPWIDSDIGNGWSREELKTQQETNKILGIKKDKAIPIEGTCVRVPTLRCHALSCLVYLKENLSAGQCQAILQAAHPWINIVENTKETTLAELTPAMFSGSLQIGIGRIRKSRLGGKLDEKYLNLFIIGDQLLWGAAEPLRRMLPILIKHLSTSPAALTNKNNAKNIA